MKDVIELDKASRSIDQFIKEIKSDNKIYEDIGEYNQCKIVQDYQLAMMIFVRNK